MPLCTGNTQRLNDVIALFERPRRNTIPSYVEGVIPSYTDEEFVMHFRLKRGVVWDMIENYKSSDEFASLQGIGSTICVL
jgi:hypothetical protein